MRATLCASALIVLISGAVGQLPWCTTNTICPEDPTAPTCTPELGYALQENGCYYPGCPCGTEPIQDSDVTCQAKSFGQFRCPKNCGGRAEDWWTAVNGCKTCICVADVGREKAGTCPANTAGPGMNGITNYTSNTPERVFQLGKICTEDFDCRGIQKCCFFSVDSLKHCVDPEPRCPRTQTYPYNYWYGARCETNADCEFGDACCGFFRKWCFKGELPQLPPVIYGDRTVPSPEIWA